MQQAPRLFMPVPRRRVIGGNGNMDALGEVRRVAMLLKPVHRRVVLHRPKIPMTEVENDADGAKFLKVLVREKGAEVADI